jgi:hypothetical protein
LPDGIAAIAFNTSDNCFANAAVGDDAGPPQALHITPSSISAANRSRNASNEARRSPSRTVAFKVRRGM